MTPSSEPSAGQVTRVVVATSVMLTFISFWRAAAIVLNDLGSSAFYVGGIAEQAIGQVAPWFILAVMLFSYAVRAVYVESCAMFTRGGVYRVVKEAMGGTLAKLSVSALMFDYILTGPISGVSAGQYIVGLIAQTVTHLGYPWHPAKETINTLAAGIAILITGYFWWRNTRGIRESSGDALKIMYVTTVMVLLMIAWSGVTILIRPDTRRLPPAPVPHNLAFNEDAVGWLPAIAPGALRELPNEAPAATAANPDTAPAAPRYGIPGGAGTWLGLLGLLIAFGHSVLAMSGEESLAQVNRELEHPKHINLMRAGIVIFIYSLLFTSLVSFFAYAIIPDQVRPQFSDNLISGIAMHVAGPVTLKLGFQAFIVVVGFLMLAGAVNTAIVGSNGVLNRVSEDGVLSDWFRAPHRRYGTTYRLISLIVFLQLLTIIGSRGDIYVLGEAYAFGVIWSFAFKALAVLVLRFRDPSPREWKVPMNFRLFDREIPLGLGLITLLLFAIAAINLLTKQVATVSGAAFTVFFFSLFLISERLSERWRSQAHAELDRFQLQTQEAVSTQALAVRPRNILCAVRDYNNLAHVQWVLERTDTSRQDVVVMTVRVLQGPNTGYRDIDVQELFTTYEQQLFSRVVAVAEKVGKPVSLLVVPSSDAFQATVRTAMQLETVEIIAGRSAVLTPTEQARRFGRAWEQMPDKPRRQIRLRVVVPQSRVYGFFLGAHTPQLAEEDVERIHRLWLELTQVPGKEHAHHRDVVHLALRHLEENLAGPAHDELVAAFATTPARKKKA
jgi:amino acid transporter